MRIRDGGFVLSVSFGIQGMFKKCQKKLVLRGLPRAILSTALIRVNESFHLETAVLTS